MTNQDLISGLFDASIYILPLLVGGLLWFSGRRRDPESPVMVTLGGILVFIFGLGLVGRVLIWISSADGFSIDSDTATIVAVALGAVVALAIVIPLAIFAGRRIGKASVRQGGSYAAAPDSRPAANGGSFEPIHKKGPSTKRVLTLSLLGIVLFFGLIIGAAWLLDANGSSASAAPTTTTVSATTSSTATSTVASGAAIPETEWKTVDALFDRGTAFQLSIDPEGDLRAYGAEAELLATAWFELAAEGSEVAGDAYLCKARGFEQMADFFRYVDYPQPDEAEAAIARAEEYDIRGSDLLGELEGGFSLRPEGSPRTCP